MPSLSPQFADRKPSAVRVAQLEYMRRTKTDTTIDAVNVSIGDVSLPMHPAMIHRLAELGTTGHAFADGAVRYADTIGSRAANETVMHILSASGCDTTGVMSMITSGGSQAMELAVIGVGGPLLFLDATYPNYHQFAKRLHISTCSLTRTMSDTGHFELPTIEEIDRIMTEKKPSAILIIPYDNPTGQFYTQSQINAIAKLTVAHDIWLISDEAYRELYYTDDESSSIWKISERDVPGITGRRISIESTSKVWNACGLRIGALITDNEQFLRQAVAENTANLAANTIGQEVFTALKVVSHDDLHHWFTQQRTYYRGLMEELYTGMQQALPGAILSRPSAAIYSVIEVRDLVGESFDAAAFVQWCATEGSVDLQGIPTTLLTTPMGGFYAPSKGMPNPGRTQLRIAYVESPERMRQVPTLCARLLEAYVAQKALDL